MARIRVNHAGVTDLARDMKRIVPKAARDMARVVKRNAERGNKLAQQNASRTAGAHGKYYPGVFTVESRTPMVYEYGPDADIVVQGRKGSIKPGGMAPGFEHGSRNSPPHHDLAKSADVIGPKFEHEVGKLPDRWFW